MPGIKFSIGQSVRVIAMLLVFAACCVPGLCARDAFVLISGGDSPFENNYSQYLQAKAVAAFFEQNYPRDSVWTFFGAGNVEGQKPVLCDVIHEAQRDGVAIDSWVPGTLNRNRPATRDVILRALREEILPAVADGGTLYLFVGDHGSRADGGDGESIIALWSLERDPKSEHGWRSNDGETLGVAELRRVLANGIGKGRVVFCMTQCHAGGFHYLAIPREMTPNPKWFTKVPDWAAPKKQPVFVNAAGFTATDEFSPAAGCDPDPNPETWTGYERYLPENLLGMNLFTLASTGKGLRSFAEAHAAATLVDRTIDKPYSTSEQYLERWANLIETRLARERNLTENVKKLVTAYQRRVDGAVPQNAVSDAAFRERQSLFHRFTQRLTEQNPSVEDLLLTGTRKELEEAMGLIRSQGQQQRPPRQQGPGQPQRRGRRGGGAFSERRRLWNETVRPAWQTAVEANRATGLPSAALEFEKHLLKQEANGRNYFFGGASLMENEIFWQSGYGDPQTMDPAKAEAIAQWGAERRSKILAWAKTAEDKTVRDAAERLSPTGPPRQPDPAPQQVQSSQPAPAAQSNVSTQLPDRRTAAERVLFYRRVLAAWEFLLAVNERPALARLRELTELERTPLPSPKPGNAAVPAAARLELDASGQTPEVFERGQPLRLRQPRSAADEAAGKTPF